jgi:Ca2+-binding EF-hand superfamily protein
MKTSYLSLFLVFPAALAACGGQEADELIDESAAVALSSDDPDADANTEETLAANDMDFDEAAADRTDAMTRAEPQEAIFSCDFSALREQIKARFDVNGDGTLDRQERAELRDHLDDHPRVRFARRLLLGGRKPHLHVWKRIKWAFDTDNDGTLSDSERAELIAASEARCERRRANFIERFDTDGDGQLTREEVRAGIEAVRARWQEKKAEFLAQWDANGDGELDDTERAALREHLQSRREEIKARVIEAFDADGDGMLGTEELAALKAAIRAKYVDGFNS